MNGLERWLLWGSTVLAGLTGLAYAWMKYLMASDDPYAVVHHPLQPWVLKAHILVAPLLVFAVGTVFLRHVVGQWRSHEPDARRSGRLVFVLFVAMVSSGYLIQAAASGPWARWLGWAHLGAGAAYLVVMAAHQAVAALLAQRDERTATEADAEQRGADDVPGLAAPAADRASIRVASPDRGRPQSSVYRSRNSAPKA